MPFFELSLLRISSAIRIQLAWKTFKERRKRPMLFVEILLRKRAIFFFQRWWKDYKLKKRMQTLSLINAYIHKINDSVVYVEEEFYNNLVSFIQKA